jgi:hypothetical protein
MCRFVVAGFPVTLPIQVNASRRPSPTPFGAKYLSIPTTYIEGKLSTSIILHFLEEFN